MARKGKPDR